jgi:predicted metal-dependent hydrolase
MPTTRASSAAPGAGALPGQFDGLRARLVRWEFRLHVGISAARNQPRSGGSQIRFAKPGCNPFTRRVTFQFILDLAGRSSTDGFLDLGRRQVPLVLVRNPRARRYVLRLRPDGSARVTIPRGGTAGDGRRFAERHAGWIGRQLLKQDARPVQAARWLIGTEILFRGDPVKIEAGDEGSSGWIRLGGEVVRVADPAADLRPELARHLPGLAVKELGPRVLECAAAHRLRVRRITVRDQRSRWGSCSRRGTISLNWRLIQAPPFVRDYIILHELMHLREMNHSPRFWREVERACPDYPIAETWLKQHSDLLK